MELSRKSRLPFSIALGSFCVFSFIFCYDLIFLNRYLNHPEYVTYYHAFRIWFLKSLANGHFPQWNPYWGLGHTTEIEASFPLDIYSLFELLFGAKYHWFQLVQCFFILASGFWCFQTLGVPVILSVVGTLAFFLSPWVNYFFFYFIKANSFIGLFLSFPLVVKWFQTGNKKLLPLIALATVFTMSGTKLDFWFFHFSFFIIFSIIFSIQTKASQSRLYWFGGAILLGVLSQSWQWISLYQILAISDRIGKHYGAQSFLMGEFYYNFAYSIASSSFIKMSLFCFFLYKATNTENRTRWFWGVLGLLVMFICKLWKNPIVQGLISSEYGIGVVMGLLILTLSEGTKRKAVLNSLLFFIPLSFYWCRPTPGDLNEITVLHSAPFGLKVSALCLSFLGCSILSKNRLAKTAYLCLLTLFLMRDQGQILLSYFFGLVWIPTRDNFIFEFLFALLGVLALATLKNYKVYGFLFSLILVLSPVKNYYYSHPLIEKVSNNYPVYEGESELNSFLMKKGKDSTDRYYFLGKHYASRLPMYASSLLQSKNQVHMFSSFMPKNFHDWSVYQWFGFLPEDHWSSYEGEYTEETISKLPFRNTRGIHTNHVYWYALHAAPPPNLNTLKFIGVNRVISEEPIPKTSEFFNFSQKGKYYTAQLNTSLPKAFSLPLTENSKKMVSLAFKVPEVREKSLRWESMEVAYTANKIQSYQNERIILNTLSDEATQLVLTELHHPFWHAKVDGIEVPIQPAFSIFRSLEIPKGRHSVEFYCTIPYFRLSLTLSALSFIGILFWFLFLTGERTLFMGWMPKLSRNNA